MTEGTAGETTGAPAAPPTCYRHHDRETWISCQRCSRPICPDCMTSASVGFQCPECVREGARSTRSGRTAYGGQRVDDPRATTLGLIALNVAVWLSIIVTGSSDGPVFRALALLPESSAYRLDDGSVTVVDGVSGGALWQVLTANFTHFSPFHILLNMFFLLWVGPIIEAPIGRARFLAACLVTGLTSSAAVMWLSNPHAQTMGFSGIAMGLFGMFVVLALKVGRNTNLLVQMIGFQLVFNLLARDVISWQGHLGGFVGGVLLGAIIAYAPRTGRSRFQWGGMALVGLVAVGLILVRAADLAAGSPFG